MIKEIEKLIDGYSRWLRDKTILRELDDQYVEITTPYLDRHNDYTQIYARRENGGFLLSDGGETIDDLRASGCDLDTHKRKNLLLATLNGFGIQRDGDALVVKTTPQNFPLRKHNLVQAMLAVNDMFYLAVPMVASIFLEDVAAWLDSNEIRYTPNIKFTGRSGFDHSFDFVVPASRRAPERLIRAINSPNPQVAKNLDFSWIDTKDVRPQLSRLYAILNDQEKPPADSVMEALKSYEIRPVPWSAREEFKQELAA